MTTNTNIKGETIMDREEILNIYQIEKILRGQEEIVVRLDRLLSIFAQNSIRAVISPVLNFRQAAELLNVSQASLIGACRNNEVPCRKIGSNYVFRRDALLDWLNSNETKADINESIDSETAAYLLDVPVPRVRKWAKEYMLTGIPVINEGSRLFFDKDELLTWAVTPEFKKLKENYIKNRTLNEQRRKDSQAKYEEEMDAQRIEIEAKRKSKIEKKLAAAKINKKFHN